MSNYSNQRPFFYNIFTAFRPYAAHKNPSSSPASTSHTFSSATSSQTQAQSTSSTFSSPSSSPTGPHAQITQAATARAIASKSNPSSQPFQSAAAAAFSPPSHHTTKHTHATSPGPQQQQTPRRPPGAASPYGQHRPGFGGRNRRGSDSSSGDEGFAQRPGAEKWFVGGRMGNGEDRFYQLSMVKRERSGDRRSCDRMSL